MRIGVTWACFKNLGHLPCLSEALIIEVMEMMRMFSNLSKGSKEHDFL